MINLPSSTEPMEKRLCQAEEQQALNDNDDQVSELRIRIQRLIILSTTPLGRDTVRVANRQLTLLRAKLESIDAAVHDIDDSEEDATCTLEEYREQVTEVKTELATLKTSLLASEVPTDDSIIQDQARVEKVVLIIFSRLKNAFVH